MNKRLFFMFFALVAMIATVHAEVINLGEMQLDVDYVLQDFKGYKGVFTAPKSGVVTCSSTTTDDMEPYTDQGCTKPCSITKNSLYGAHTYDVAVEEGKKYYFYTSFIMNSGTVFKLSMAEKLELILESSSPAIGADYNVSGDGQVSFNFNKAVTYTGATITVGNYTDKKLSGQTFNSSIFFNSVRSIVWECLENGTAKSGDDMTIKVSGISMATNSDVKYNEDGNLIATFKIGKMPAILVSSDNTSGDFLSYYTIGDEKGIVKLHFDKPVSTDMMNVQIKYGSIDKEADGDYYIEHLTPELSEDKMTVMVNLQGKRRKPSDMVASGTAYATVALGFLGVTDEDGNYTYSPGQGSLGSYWFSYNYKEITANVVAEFSPAPGADITSKTKRFEIWITDEDKLSYDGMAFSYKKDGVAETLLVANEQISKEADPDDATAKILTFAVPAELIGAEDVELYFNNLQCADGSDYSNVLRAKYSSFVIQRATPVAGSTIEKFTAGQQIKIFTNRDAVYDHLTVSLTNADDLSVLFEGTAIKSEGGKGFVFTCHDNRWLDRGTDYHLNVTATTADGKVSSDYIVYHGAAVTVDDFFCYGYQATGITLQDTLVSGQIKTATISGFSNSKHIGDHYALLSMPAEVSNTMDGCQIKNIAFYPFLTSKTTARIVISNSIGGTPLYEQTVEGIESQKWMDVVLTTPFTIKKDEQLYIGYIIESAEGDYPVGYYYTSNPAANAVIDPIIDWIAYDEDGTIKSGMLDAQMYAARRQTANLMLYATIEASHGELPANAVAVGTTKLSNGMYLHKDAEQILTCYFTNTGVKDLESYDVTVKDGDQLLAQQTVTPATPLAPMWEGSFSVKVSTSVEGIHAISVTVDNPNAETNWYTGMKTAEKKYLVYTDSVKRNVVLEHFTTGQCVNCVKGEELIESELAYVSEDINVIRINHHSGFGSDKLTISDDTAYEWFYGETYVWAPANMIDRTDLAAYGAKGYGGTTTLGPVFGTDKSASVSSLITAAANIPSFITLNVETSVDDARELTVKVTADQLYEMPQADLMRLNVAVVQDSVKAAQTLSDGTVDKNFIHYNVLRKNLTSTWGDKVEFDGNKMEATFTCTMPAAWKEDKVRVVAFLADYDPASTKNCRIYNAVEKTIVESSTVIEFLSEECRMKNEESCFNLTGQRVGKNAKGIIIHNGKKCFVR